MASFNMDIQGLDAHQRELQDEAEQWSGDGGTWYVGTAVSYGIYLEYGTSRMDAKPFFRPVLVEAERDLSAFVRDNTKTSLSQVDSPEELVRTVAFAVERRVKEIITEKGLIDTGTLRASVQAVPGGVGELPDESEVDADASASFEVSA